MTPTNPQDGVEQVTDDTPCLACCRPRGRHLKRDLQCPQTTYFMPNIPARPIADAGSTSAIPPEPASDGVVTELIENLRRSAERDQSPGAYTRNLLRNAANMLERLATLRTAPSEWAGE